MENSHDPMKIDAFPSRIVLELTPLCNLSCPMCPRHYINEADGYMSVQLFKKLIDEIESENKQAIVLPFWRGESCLHPNFVELLHYAIDRGIRIHLSTNGHFLSQEFMDIFYRCEFVTFSLHTNIGNKNARKMVEHKPVWSKTITQISFVDSEKNTGEFLRECTSDSNLNGFDSVRLYLEHTVGGEFGKGANQSDMNRTFCPKLTHTFVVSADGGYSRCNHIWNPEVIPPLVHSSIKEVWNGSMMTEIRKMYPDKLCGPCDQWSGHTNGEAWQKSMDGQIQHIIYGASQ